MFLVRRYFLAFDGAQTASSVYLGGQFIGSHTSGYTPFHFQLSDAQADQLAGSNGGAVLAVRTDATQPDGWWYDGGGLYRHVWLKAVPKVSGQRRNSALAEKSQRADVNVITRF